MHIPCESNPERASERERQTTPKKQKRAESVLRAHTAYGSQVEEVVIFLITLRCFKLRIVAYAFLYS